MFKKVFFQKVNFNNNNKLALETSILIDKNIENMKIFVINNLWVRLP